MRGASLGRRLRNPIEPGTSLCQASSLRRSARGGY